MGSDLNAQWVFFADGDVGWVHEPPPGADWEAHPWDWSCGQHMWQADQRGDPAGEIVRLEGPPFVRVPPRKGGLPF